MVLWFGLYAPSKRWQRAHNWRFAGCDRWRPAIRRLTPPLVLLPRYYAAAYAGSALDAWLLVLYALACAATCGFWFIWLVRWFAVLAALRAVLPAAELPPRTTLLPAMPCLVLLHLYYGSAAAWRCAPCRATLACPAVLRSCLRSSAACCRAVRLRFRRFCIAVWFRFWFCWRFALWLRTSPLLFTARALNSAVC